MAVDPKNPLEPGIDIYVDQLCEELRELKRRTNLLESQVIRAPGAELLQALPAAVDRKGKLASFDPVTGDLLATAPASGTPEDMGLAIAAKLARDGSEAMTGNLRVPGNVTLDLEVPPLQQVRTEALEAVEAYRGADLRIAELPETSLYDNAYSSMIVKLEDGRLVGWGRSTARHLGTGNEDDGSIRPSFSQFAPRIPDGVTIAGFRIGSADSFVWLSNGWVYHAGLNTRGIGGHGDTVIRPMFTRINFFFSSGLSVVDVKLASYRPDDQFSNALFLCSSGDVYFSGYSGVSGASGDGNMAERTVSTPTQCLLSDIVGIASRSDNDSSNFAWRADGSCFAWGQNIQGSLGIGSTSATATPVQISGILVNKVVSRTAVNNSVTRYSSTMFLLKDGTVRAAGYNNGGQLGDGTIVDRSTPVAVAGLTDIIDIGIGGGDLSWGWGVTSTKRLKMWGWNHHYVLGVGDTVNRSTAIEPIGWFDEAGNEALSGDPPFQGKVVKVITGKTVAGGPIGRQQTVVLDEDGNVWVSGYNDTYTVGWTATQQLARFKRAALTAVAPGDKIIDIHHQGHSTVGGGVRLFALTEKGRLLMSGINNYDLGTAMPMTSTGPYRAVFLQPVRLGV